MSSIEASAMEPATTPFARVSNPSLTELKDELDYTQIELEHHLTADVMEFHGDSDQLKNLSAKTKKSSMEFITLSRELSKRHITMGSVNMARDIRLCQASKQEDVQELLLSIHFLLSKIGIEKFEGLNLKTTELQYTHNITPHPTILNNYTEDHFTHIPEEATSFSLYADANILPPQTNAGASHFPDTETTIQRTNHRYINSVMPALSRVNISHTVTSNHPNVINSQLHINQPPIVSSQSLSDPACPIFPITPTFPSPPPSPPPPPRTPPQNTNRDPFIYTNPISDNLH